MKKFLLCLGVLVMLVSVLGVAACAEEAPTPGTTTYQWKIGHSKPVTESQHVDVSWLVNEINQNSNGRITTDIYPAGQLGDYTVVQERVSLGAVEMYIGPLATSRDKRLMLAALPYMVNDWDAAFKIYRSGSFLMDTLDGILADQNIKLLCSWPYYFGGILLTELPPPGVDLGDPDVPKNIKIRVPPMKQFELMAEAYGFIATPIPWSEAYTALQSGIVDGVLGGGTAGYWANFPDVMKYYLEVNDHFECHYVYTNLDLWNSLSEGDQKIIQDAALEMEARRAVDAVTKTEVYYEIFRNEGIEIITFSDAELAKMAKKAHEVVWPAVRDDIGGELIDKVMAELE